MLVPLKDLVDQAAANNYIVPSFNIFGYEDAKAVVDVAEDIQAPVILAANLTAVKHMPLVYMAPLLLQIANKAAVPVCVHLDHGGDYESIKEAVQLGFSSVMYDDSQLPLHENIKRTCEIVQMAGEHGVSVEAEIGSVGYSDPAIKMRHVLSDPDETEQFVRETGIDAVAVSVGTVHRMEYQQAHIHFDLLESIQDKVGVPLVIHGSSGLVDQEICQLRPYRIGKINIGTALRMAFGHTLRKEIESHPEMFDRIELFQQSIKVLKEVVRQKFEIIGSGRGAF